MSQKTVRLALIGASEIVSRILPYIKAVPNLEIAGIAASTAQRAKSFAEQHAIPNVFNSYNEAFNSNYVDAVYISVLSADHFTLILSALRSGKHVICEKPIVLTTTQAEQITNLARAQNLILLEAMMYRFHPHTLALQKSIPSLGKLKSIQLTFSFILDLSERRRGLKIAGGGATYDLGSYLVDFLISNQRYFSFSNYNCPRPF